MPKISSDSSSDQDSETDSDEKHSRGGDKSRNEKTEPKLKLTLTKEELKYRKKNFDSIEELLSKHVRCTSCARELRIRIESGSEVPSHPILDVLLCKECARFYGNGDFSVDEDGTDKYCRWCGQGGTLYCCSECTCAFCKACIKRNLNRSILKDIESEDWKCFVCYGKPLWNLRAICWAAKKYSAMKRREQRLKNKKALEKLKEKRMTPSPRKKPSRSHRSLRSETSTPEVVSIDSGSENSDTTPRKLLNSSEHAKRSLFCENSSKHDTKCDTEGEENHETNLHENKQGDFLKAFVGSDCEQKIKEMERERTPSEGETEELQGSYALGKESTREICRLLAEQLKDFVSTAEIVSDQAKKMLKKKVNKKHFKVLLDVDKTVEKVQLLAELSVKNFEKAKTNTRILYEQWKKDLATKKRNKNAQDKTRKLHVNAECLILTDKPSTCVDASGKVSAISETPHSGKETGSPKLVHSDNEGSDREHCSPLIPNMLQGTSTPNKEDKIQSEIDQNNSVVHNTCSQSDEIVLKTLNDSILKSNDNKMLPQRSDCVGEKGKYEKRDKPGNLSEEHLPESKCDIAEMPTQVLNLDTVTRTNHKDSTVSCVDSDMETVILDTQPVAKGLESIPEQSNQHDVDLETTEIVGSGKVGTAVCDSQEQLSSELIDTMESILDRVDSNVSYCDIFADTEAKQQSSPPCDSSGDILEPNKENKFSTVSLKSKEKLLQCSSENDSENDSKSIPHEEAQKKKRKRGERLTSRKQPRNLKEPADKNTLTKKKCGIRGLPSCSDSDSDSSVSSQERKKCVQQKKIKVDYLAQFNDEKLRNGCYVELQRLLPSSDVINNCDVNSVSDEENSSKCKNIISENDDESMDDNEEERQIRRLLSLKSLKKKANNDDPKHSNNNKVRDHKSIKKNEEEQPESLLALHKKVVDGDMSTDSDNAEDENGVTSELQTDKLEKQKNEVTPNYDETAKQLLLHDSSDSESSASLEQQDKSTKKRKRKKEVTEETDSKKCGKSEDNVDGQHEETTEEKNTKEENSPEPVGNDGHKEAEKEIPKVKVEEGGGGENTNDDIEEGEHKTSKNASEEKCKTLKKEKKEEKSESEESSNTTEKVEMENHCKEEEELNKSADCKETKGEDKTAAEETKENKPKSTWRRNKLLRSKLSETDTSEEERKWKARKKKEETENSSDRKKKRKFIVDSDSESDIKSSSGSSDLEDLFDMKRKRKHKSESSDIDSRSSSSSSIEVKKKPKPKRRRVVVPTSNSSGSDSEDLNSTQKSEGTPGKGRKNIRRVLKDENVADATKRAAREEEERKKRIAEKQKMYNELFLTDKADVEKLDKLVLDFDQETKEELVTVHKDIVKKLKPHQVKGVKFMWDTCFESLEQMKENKGTGCILAHCMGLGKTLQVVALVHTVLCHPATGIKTALIICPYSTIKNWVNEFHIWLKDLTDTGEIEVFELTKYKKNYERVYQLKNWHEDGGVMVMGYEMYRNLAGNQKLKVRKQMKDTLWKVLVDPGPDLIVCDEGHLLKNENTAISKALRKIRTLRRIVLTGTPLQNNLNEYHCMVQFVKPNLLGTKREFDNRFVNPIRNGQYVDSTLHDVKVMKRRAHVLHKMLESSVQRFDYAVLTPFLPPKMEYVISVRLSEAQVKLYRYYLDNFSAASELNDCVRGKGAKLFKDFQALQRIWTHPRVIRMDAERKEKEEERKQMMESDTEGSLVDFVVDDSSSDSDTSSNSSSVEEVVNDDKKPSSDNDVVEITEKEEEKQDEPSSEWWEQFVTSDDMDDIRSSGKLMLLFYILQESEKIGDKVLVFSQSLLTLDLIEYFLGKIDEATQQSSESDEKLGNFRGSWSIGLDYFRLDGSTSAENRNIWCKNFNKESNYRARLFLISTKAGGLGINLVAANRVVLFDASWNPSHDVQSIFRIYRFGQKKPCYVYRFLAQGTMEEKIYDRQVTKLSLSCRVVDEQQIERHYNMADLQEMYMFDPEQVSKRPTPMLPKDRMLAELLKEHEYWVITYHEHDSLLQNKEEEELNEEERKAAWEEYENEKQGKVPTVTMGFINQQAGMFQGPVGQFQMSILRDLIRNENPQATEAQVSETLTNQLTNQMLGRTVNDNFSKMLQQIQQKLMINTQSSYFQAGHPTQLQYSMPYVNKDGKTISYPYIRKEVTAVPSTSRAPPIIKVKDFGQMRDIGPNPMYKAPLTTPGALNQNSTLASLLQPSVSKQQTPSDDSIEIID